MRRYSKIFVFSAATEVLFIYFLPLSTLYGFLIDKFENHADLFSNFNDVLHFIMKEKKKLT